MNGCEAAAGMWRWDDGWKFGGVGRGWGGGGDGGLGRRVYTKKPNYFDSTPSIYQAVQTRTKTSESEMLFVCSLVEVLLDVHRSRRFIRDGSPGRPPRLSHSS